MSFSYRVYVKIALTVLFGILANSASFAQECPDSGSTALTAAHDFDMFDPATEGGTQYVGTVWDNTVMQFDFDVDYQNVDTMGFPVTYWNFIAHIPNPHPVGSTTYCVDDADSDGMSDSYEDEIGLDSGVDDADSDEDGDGESNISEFLDLVGGGGLPSGGGSSGGSGWADVDWAASTDRYCGPGTEYICISDGVRISN